MKKPSIYYEKLAAEHPEIVRAYEALGDASRAAGPIDPVNVELVKLAFAAGAKIESGVRAHVRRALESGATPAQILHVPLLAITTLGFPSAMTIRGIVQTELEKRLPGAGKA
jgi:4-carboxymuconolactone decarboxylase